ncbi:MAG: hypothetical protein COA91_13110 [Robiginitomaculum sp.]|nr:MAG: hypothetical protein COA91_13110 [Robiginitomaculum sp.]
MFLEDAGHEVKCYHDGASALEALSKNPVDIAVFDIKMPRMDGMELLRRLRQTSNMPVISPALIKRYHIFFGDARFNINCLLT